MNSAHHPSTPGLKPHRAADANACAGSLASRTPAACVVIGFCACAIVCASAATVMNQIGTTGAYNFTAAPGPAVSQIFTDFPDYDSVVLEDFTVSGSDLTVVGVSALFRAQGGFSAFQDVSGYRLSIFSAPALAATGLGGDVASLLLTMGSGASVVQIPGGLGDAYEYGLVTLSESIHLPAQGTYWIGISPVSSYSVTGSFELMCNGATGPVTPGNNSASFANPGEGLGLGSLSALSGNYAYSIEAVPEPSAALLAALGSAALLRRRRKP